MPEISGMQAAKWLKHHNKSANRKVTAHYARHTSRTVVCVEVSMRSKSVRLNFYHWCKTPSSGFSKKIQRQPHFFHDFGRAPSDLQLRFIQLKTLAPSVRYSTCKYIVTLKPGLGVTQGHQKWYQSIRHPQLPTKFHRNYRPISHHFWDKRRFPSKIANFSHPRVYI